MFSPLDTAAEQVQACLDEGTWRMQLQVISAKAEPELVRIAETVSKHERDVSELGAAGAFLYYAQGMAKVIACFDRELYRRDTATSAAIYVLAMAANLRNQARDGQAEDDRTQPRGDR